jgi:hypothetical protein
MSLRSWRHAPRPTVTPAASAAAAAIRRGRSASDTAATVFMALAWSHRASTDFGGAHEPPGAVSSAPMRGLRCLEHMLGPVI